MRTFYFDMDGVLVHFSEEDSKTRPFLRVGNHYYRHLEPNPVAVELFEYLGILPDVYPVVCTRLYYRDAPPRELPELLSEQRADKLAWCKQYLNLPEQDFLCLPMETSKNKVINEVPYCKREESVLLDDDTRMLFEWCHQGGKGAQFIQSHRTNCQNPAWVGAVLHDVSVEDAIETLKKYKLL